MDKREEVQKAAVEDIRDCDYTGAYVISPRVGKSKIAIDALMDKFPQWKITIAVPRQVIMSTWVDEIIKWGPSVYQDIDILCFASLKKIDEEVDLLLVDEWHMLSVNQMEIIKKKNPKRILLLTGTANEYSRNVLRYHLGIEVRFEYSIGEAIVDGIISNFHVYVVKVPMDNESKTRMVHGAPCTERQAYDYYTFMFDDLRVAAKVNLSMVKAKEAIARRRAQLVYTTDTKVDVASRIVHAIRDRVLVFTARTAIADRLSPYSYHSKNKGEKNFNRFLNEEINTLSVVNMTDMGITFPRLKYEVVHQLQSNSEVSLQKFLRACNLEDDKEAKIFITVYKDTMDETWAQEAMVGVPEGKITWLEIEELENLLNEI